MTSDLQHYSFRMPNIGFQNLPLNIYIVVFGTAIFVFILSLLFCCYLIRLRHQAHKELYAYKQVSCWRICSNWLLYYVNLAFRLLYSLCISLRCLIKWLEVRKVCPLCNMPVLQLAQQQSMSESVPPLQQPLPGVENLV
uniref:Ring finger protein 24 n=1 Tax=Sinocyclocheilus rhinocerous TaxID=307959 RepID=A0A673IA35_9TELE